MRVYAIATHQTRSSPTSRMHQSVPLDCEDDTQSWLKIFDTCDIHTRLDVS